MVEKVHLKFCKLLINLKTSTANCLVYDELAIGVFLYLLISYWTKPISGKRTNLFSITYRSMFHLFSTQNVNFQWRTCIPMVFFLWMWAFLHTEFSTLLTRNGLRKKNQTMLMRPVPTKLEWWSSNLLQCGAVWVW